MSSPEEYAQNAQWRDADANIFSGDDGSFREGILTNRYVCWRSFYLMLIMALSLNSLQSVIDEASPSSVLEVQKKRGVLHLIALTVSALADSWWVNIRFQLFWIREEC